MGLLQVWNEGYIRQGSHRSKSVAITDDNDVELVLSRLYDVLNVGGHLLIVDFNKNEKNSLRYGS